MRDVFEIIKQITGNPKHLEMVVEASQKFYKDIASGKEEYPTDIFYKTYRRVIYNILKKLDPEWGAGDRIYTSVIVDRLVLSIYPRSAQINLIGLREHYPDYVQADLKHYKEMQNSINPAGEIELPRINCGIKIKEIDKSCFANHPQPTKGIEMTQTTAVKPPIIEVKTFIAGRDSTTVSDDQIYAMIQVHEAEIAALSSVGHKPKSLKDRIEVLKNEIKQLVDFADKRLADNSEGEAK